MLESDDCEESSEYIWLVVVVVVGRGVVGFGLISFDSSTAVGDLGMRLNDQDDRPSQPSHDSRANPWTRLIRLRLENCSRGAPQHDNEFVDSIYL